jgi:hypothetical protein
MTKEDKKLLFRYLSMALPYEVKILHNDWDYDRDCEFSSVETLIGIDDRFIHTLCRHGKDEHSIQEPLSIVDYKPFLRPMSSMTEEEDEKRIKLGIWRGSQTDGYAVTRISPDIPECYNSQAFQNALKFLLREHFDIFGLIPKGLAIEVTQGNNPYSTRKG